MASAAANCDQMKLLFKPTYAIYGLLGTSVATMVASYTIAIVTSKVDAGRFLISDTFGLDPARAVSCFGLSLMAVFAFVIFTCRYLIGTGSRCETIALCLAGCASVCMFGVHAVTLPYSSPVHNLFAFGLFVSGIVAAWLNAREELKQQGGKFTPLLKLRYVLIICSVFCLCLMISGFFIFYNYSVASVAEIAMAACIFACLSSYHHDFRSKYISISLTQTDK